MAKVIKRLNGGLRFLGLYSVQVENPLQSIDLIHSSAIFVIVVILAVISVLLDCSVDDTL